jgi:hypothetical protein
MDELETEARYHRERLALYKAKVYGSAPTSTGHLRKLEQASEYADLRLKRGKGLVPSKGAMAAERASAGLGTSDDDAMRRTDPPAALTVWAKPPPRGPGKQRPTAH